MNIVGPPLNKVAIIPKEFQECNINQAITLFRVKKYLNHKFLYYYLREGSPVNNLVNETRGVVGQVNISLTQCREFKIPIPPQKEQEEIVRRVETLFAQVDAIETCYATLRMQIEALPQSILAKAFRGELVPQLAEDGDARDLLEQIKQLKAETSSKRKGKKKNKVKTQPTEAKEKRPSSYPLHALLLKLKKACGEEELKRLSKLTTVQFIKQLEIELSAGKVEGVGSPIQYKIPS